VNSWTSVPSAADWAAAVGSLKNAQRILLLAHVSPDADAIGSALAVGIALRSAGKKVSVSFGDEPFVLPANLMFLPGQELLVAPAEVSGDFEVVASFDVSAAARLGRLEDSALTAPTLIAVDHHRTYTGFGTMHLVDVGSPATAVLALRLIEELGIEVSPATATCLYAGLLTDTGSFRYANVTASTHDVAARLHDFGIDHVAIGRHLYDDQSFAAVRLQGAALARAEIDPGAIGGMGMAWTIVPLAERSTTGTSIDVLERVIDGLRTATEAEVVVVLKQDDSGQWRVSTRSKGAIDMGTVCQRLGGGGHLIAGGFESDDSPDEILAALRAALAEEA
jgi:phosphoesterase RecJ-like protein